MANKTKVTVKAGDTYSTVSKKLGVPEEVLKAANKGVVTFKPGQVINSGLKGGITTGAGTSSGQQVISTGANKDVVTLPNGNKVQMGPNTTVTIPGQAPGILQQIQTGVKNAIGVLQGTNPSDPGGAGTIRGKVPGLASPAQNVFSNVNAGAGVVGSTNGNMRTRQNPTGVQYTGNPGTFQFGTAGMYNYANYTPLGTTPRPNTGTAGYWGQSSRAYLESQQQAPATNVFSQVQSGGGMAQNITPNGDMRTRQNPTGVQYTGNPGTFQFGTAGMYNYNQANYAPMGTTQRPYTGTAGYWGQSSRAYLESQQASQAQRSVPLGTNVDERQQPRTQNGTPIQQPGVKSANQNYNPSAARASAQVNAAVRPTDANGNVIPYTGNPNDPATALWKKYWDDSAKAGRNLASNGEAAPPPVMTRAQIWDMKAAQRRRQMAKNGEVITSSQADFVPTDANQIYAYPDNIKTIIWGA